LFILKHSFGHHHRIFPSSVGCLSLNVFPRSSALHISFTCRLFIPRSILPVFNTEYCFRVRVVCPSKFLFAILHHSMLFRYMLTYQSKIPEAW
jgi:hypothetical protein